MIRVEVRSHDHQISEMTITGHAESDVHGKDLVCAGVSSIAIGLCNAIDLLKPSFCEMSVENNRIHIQVLKTDVQLHTILSTGLIQLQTVEEVYGNYIHIHKTEV